MLDFNEESNEEKLTLIVDESQKDQRIDKYLAFQFEDYTRSFIQKLIKDNHVLVNNKVVKANYKVTTQDEICVILPELKPLEVTAENIPLDIVYEDSDLIILNKPKNMVVHPAPGHTNGTLVNGLLYHCKDDLSGINGVMRPGIVHRIDRNTTGLLVVCKNDKAHNSLAEQLKVHSITRQYVAIVYGAFKEAEGTVEGPIGRHPVDRKKMAINHKNGKNAVTHYKVLRQFANKYSLVECQLETGRTHQIRVHMASIGHPLLGDDIYGPSKSPYALEGQTLHAKTLGFIHPSTNKYMEFEAPLPEYFEQLIHKLEHLK